MVLVLKWVVVRHIVILRLRHWLTKTWPKVNCTVFFCYLNIGGCTTHNTLLVKHTGRQQRSPPPLNIGAFAQIFSICTVRVVDGTGLGVCFYILVDWFPAVKWQSLSADWLSALTLLQSFYFYPLVCVFGVKMVCLFYPFFDCFLEFLLTVRKLKRDKTTKTQQK